MKYPTQNGEMPDIGRLASQTLQCFLSIANHLTRFFQKNVAQVVFVKGRSLALAKRFDSCRCYGGNQARHGVGSCLGIFFSHCHQRIVGRLGKPGLTCQRGKRCQCVKLHRELLLGSAGIRVLNNRTHLLGQTVAAGGHTVSVIELVRSAHDRPELAFFVVVYKELFCQRRLVVEHVNQKAQRPEVISQLIESTCGAGLLLVHIGDQHLLDTTAHAQHGLGGLIETQYRQNTTHLGQLTGYFPQNSFVFWISKKQIQ